MKRWAGSAGIEDRAHADSKPKARKKREIAATEDGKEESEYKREGSPLLGNSLLPG